MGYKNSKVAIAKKMEDATLKVFNDFRELNLLKQGHDSLYFLQKGLHLHWIWYMKISYYHIKLGANAMKICTLDYHGNMQLQAITHEYQVLL
jgi:hypothetical protein